MPRYVKQRNTYSCGVIAVINALKWAGYNFTYDQLYNVLSEVLQTNSEIGTEEKYLDKVLKLFGSKVFSVTHVKSINFKQLNKEIEEGHAVILLTHTDDHDKDMHYFLVIGKQDKKFIAINLFTNESESLITEKQLRFYLDRKKLKNIISSNDMDLKKARKDFKYYPQAWILESNET